MRFPPDFWWGASTSSYQIEGDNRDSALWEWERKKGWERSGKAADSWRLWREDLKCLKVLNLNTYRFSVEWSRIEPLPGQWREDALERYTEMAAALVEAGIRPIVCLHHFSDPAWLCREVPDGWRSPDAVKFFARFAGKVAQALKGSVREWMVFNEPMVFLTLGYSWAHFPPGRFGLHRMERDFLGKGGLIELCARAHVEAAEAIRKARPDALVGIAHNVTDLEPARDNAADKGAVRDWDELMHWRLIDRLVQAKALDYLGINYYTRVFVRRVNLPGVPLRALPGHAEVEQAAPFLFRLLGGKRGDRPRTDMGWEIVPEGLERVLTRAWERYRLPLVVTENGIADAKGDRREAYLRDHLAAMARAMAAGASIRGYLHWSLMDNYEWGSFKPQFGLFHVDRVGGSYERTLAPGAEFYAKVAGKNELP